MLVSDKDETVIVFNTTTLYNNRITVDQAAWRKRRCTKNEHSKYAILFTFQDKHTLNRFYCYEKNIS